MDDFCQYNLFKKPQPNLFIPPPYARKSEGIKDYKRTPNLQLKASDPSKLFLLLESLQDHSSKDLEIKINKYLLDETDCQAVFMLTLVAVHNEAIVRVISDTILPIDIHMPANDQLIVEILEYKDGIEFQLESFSVGLLDIIKSVVPDITGNVYSFPIFEFINKNGISETTNRAALCIFVVNCAHQKMFVSHLVHETFRFMLPVLYNLIMWEEETRAKKQAMTILAAARILFELVSTFNVLIENTSEQIKSITDSSRCFLYLLDEYGRELDVLVFDARKKAKPAKVPKNIGIVGCAFTTNKVLNIKDPYNHPLFLKTDDDKMGFTTKNILCFPIRDERQNIGVIMLCNKQEGDYNVFDEEAVKMFGIYCGVIVAHAVQHRRMQEITKMSTISNNLLMCHIKLKQSDIKHIMFAQKPLCPEFADINFNGRDIPLHQTPLFILKMFEDLKFLERFQIDKKTLARFIVSVQYGYNNQPFHNWMHVFAVTHFAYAAICSFDMIQRKVLSELEVLAIITACLCHQVDHCGATGIHLTGNCKTLNSMFSCHGSINEKHHLSQTLCILNVEGCNFLSHLTESEYTHCLEFIKHNIFATNIALHLKTLKVQEAILTKVFKPRNKQHNLLFCSLLMTCATLCDQTRGWKNARVVAALMHEEYFQKGDLEAAMGREPPPLMDREKACIPDLQMDFLRDTCLPTFRILSIIFPASQFCIDSIMYNLKCWESARRFFLLRVGDTTSMDVLRSERLSFTESQLYAVDQEEEAGGPEDNFVDY